MLVGSRMVGGKEEDFAMVVVWDPLNFDFDFFFCCGDDDDGSLNGPEAFCLYSKTSKALYFVSRLIDM